MDIIDVTVNFFRNEAISRTFLFEDDLSIDIDINDNSIVDMDGFSVAPEIRLKSIENKMNISIVR